MPRLHADIRISIKLRGKPCHKIELIRQPAGARYWVRRDGRNSARLPTATATDVANRIRHMIAVKAMPAASGSKAARTGDIARQP